jgi:MinD-like ATPase involved in chromosome partitioning or flagellar assembly
MNNGYFIRVCSQKGGVGKTTIAVNLAVALAELNYKVLIVDEDLMSPAVGFYLGIENVNIGIREVMEGKVDLKKAIIRHDVTGLDVLPGTQVPRDYAKTAEIKELMLEVKKLGAYDFVIFDTQPGYTPPELAKLDDEALIISTPSMVSVTSSIKLAAIFDEEGVKHNLVINRLTNKKYELSLGEIDDVYGSKSLIALPEDPQIPINEAHHIPIIISNPNSPFCSNLNVLVRFYAAKKGSMMNRSTAKTGLLDGIIAFFKGLASHF